LDITEEAQSTVLPDDNSEPITLNNDTVDSFHQKSCNAYILNPIFISDVDRFTTAEPYLGDSALVDLVHSACVEVPSKFGTFDFDYSFDFTYPSLVPFSDSIDIMPADPILHDCPFTTVREDWTTTFATDPLASSPRGLTDEHEMSYAPILSQPNPDVLMEDMWMASMIAPLDQPSNPITAHKPFDPTWENYGLLLKLLGGSGSSTEASQPLPADVAQDYMEAADNSYSTRNHLQRSVDAPGTRMTKVGIEVEPHKGIPVPCSPYRDSNSLDKWVFWAVYEVCLEQTAAFPREVQGLWHKLLFQWILIEMQRGYKVEGVRFSHLFSEYQVLTTVQIRTMCPPCRIPAVLKKVAARPQTHMLLGSGPLKYRRDTNPAMVWEAWFKALLRIGGGKSITSGGGGDLLLIIVYFSHWCESLADIPSTIGACHKALKALVAMLSDPGFMTKKSEGKTDRWTLQQLRRLRLLAQKNGA
jgi:hypothetical protein